MIDTIKRFVADRPAFLTTLAALLTLFAALAVLQGCNLASFVKVAVPPDVVKATEAITPVTLDNVDIVLDGWKRYVKTNTSKLDHAIKDAEERYAILQQLTDIGLRTVEGEMGGIPGGTILLSGLSLLAGVFLKRPGEDARVAKAKEDSYNKGLEVGSTINKT